MNGNVTMIDDLPDLTDVEGGHGGLLPPGQENKYGKYIRGSHTTPLESGMGGGGGGVEHYMESGPHGGPHSGPHGGPFPHPGMGSMGGMPRIITMPKNTPTCLEVAEHIMNCPICSKFYSNDKTAYVAAIVVLAIICIILLKRVLDD